MVLAVFLGLILTACGSAKPTIGVIISKADNGFISSLLAAIESGSDRIGSDKLTLVKLDSQGSPATQLRLVDDLIAQKVQVIVINLIQRTAALEIIGKARAADIPVVFFNLQPFSTDMTFYNQTYYVGSIAEMAGGLQAEIAVDYWLANPAVDKNKDGIMQYVSLMGEFGHPDVRIRTASLKRFLDVEGIKSKVLGETYADWGREKAHDAMAKWLNSLNEPIEVVFANNDYMAVGAIDALKEAGYFQGNKFIPVLGVDGTSLGLQAIEDGTLLGTVLNDIQGQGKAIAELAYALGRGEKTPTLTVAPLTRIDGTVAHDGRYILVPYAKITRDNYREFSRE